MVKKFACFVFSVIMLIGVLPMSPCDIAWAEELSIEGEVETSQALPMEETMQESEVFGAVPICGTSNSRVTLSGDANVVPGDNFTVCLTFEKEIRAGTFDISSNGSTLVSCAIEPSDDWLMTANGSRVVFCSTSGDEAAKITFTFLAYSDLNYGYTINTNISNLTTSDGETEVGEETVHFITSVVQHDLTKCGENLNWTLSEDGTLTISGTGAMFDISDIYRLGIYDNLWDRNAVKKLVVEEGVTNIGSGMFQWCSNLKEVSFPQSLQAVGDYAFSDCPIEEIIIPNNVVSIGQLAFIRSALTTLSIPESVHTIGMSAFYGCKSLTKVVLPGTLQNVGEYAFYGCTALTSATLGEGITSLGEYCFSDCSQLSAVTLPVSLKTLSDGVFYGCEKLKLDVAAGNPYFSVCDAFLIENSSSTLMWCCPQRKGACVIPDGVTAIAYGAFGHCESLTAIQIPASVTQIAYRAFRKCSSLESIQIPNSVQDLGGYAFAECSALKTVTLPTGITGIAYGTFSACKSLSAIEIPQNITHIGTWAFGDCSSLTAVFLPTNLKTVAGYAFCGCKALQKTLYDGSSEEWSHVAVEEYNNRLLSTLQCSDSVQIVTTASFPDGAVVALSAGSFYKESFVYNNSFSIVGISDGTYNLTFSASGYVSHTVAVTIAKQTMQLNDSIYLVRCGDINGAASSEEKAVSIEDMQCLFEYLSTGERGGQLKNSEAYFDAVADVNADGCINILDYQALYEMLRRTEVNEIKLYIPAYDIYLQKNSEGNYDISMMSYEKSFQLEVQGVTGKVLWSSSNTGVLTVSGDGTFTRLATGVSVVTGKIGTEVFTITVRCQ